MTKKAAASKVDMFAFWVSNYKARIKLNILIMINKDSTLKANFVMFTDHCVIIITFYDNWMAQLWPFTILITMWEISFGTTSRYVQETTTHSHKERKICVLDTLAHECYFFRLISFWTAHRFSIQKSAF